MLPPDRPPRWLLYGAYGYTGRLILDEAARRGLRPVLAGRDAAKVQTLATSHGLEGVAFDLETDFDHHLEGVGLVMHCAGPFSRTSRAMVDACLRKGAGYLDVTGEIAVFESILRREAEARAAGVSLIPGVGFDVVPTDCLAAHLARELPDARELDLAISVRRGGISRGTLKTMLEGLGEGGAVRREGKIRKVPAAWEAREIPFASGPRLAMSIPWGDVSTAYHTTGIPNVTVYSSASPSTVKRLRRLRVLLPLAGTAPVRWLLMRLADRKTGPDAHQRRESWIDLWGEVRNAAGERRSRTMRVPDGYAFTAVSAAMAIERVLAGEVRAGALTPALAFGDGFADEVCNSMVAVAESCASNPGPEKQESGDPADQ